MTTTTSLAEYISAFAADFSNRAQALAIMGSDTAFSAAEKIKHSKYLLADTTEAAVNILASVASVLRAASPSLVVEVFLAEVMKDVVSRSAKMHEIVMKEIGDAPTNPN